ncbi:DNA-binding CsgD family transcriptional regulator [Sphingomonas kyeonggiensis]|uniref:DNA-binding CsgD family transcriptional regulator n=2 Tax=Sphingomonas kyeonggiensis TaxID=1268553 RepID=A0A7W7K383_9SPHN|nr:DNA-binding CsgD family transcriptional regulator [Sphingomonas kyeonggiensis]
MRVTEAGWALTEKEKQTLRLIVRGHDAKSIARSLDLSVHTINERLRDARRKMAVSSSREAARLLLAAEGGPELFGDTGIGEDPAGAGIDQEATPVDGAGRAYRRPWIIPGVLLMTFALGLLALALLPSAPTTTHAASQVAPNPEVVDTARQFLVLGDQGRWDESYQATGAAFRKLNTAAVWRTVSEKVRTPLGAVVSRTLIGQENLPAPPYGYEVVKFRTSFANKAEAVETVTLEREGGAWRVVGVTID